MIPNYRRKRNVDDEVATAFELKTSNRKDVNHQITENLTRNPHVQVIFTPDATVSGGSNTVLKSEELHPFVKYGIPIGAMFLLGLFLYATFSKRWNRKTAMMTISAESMKLNTTTTIDTIAENVSCQISSAENSMLRHIDYHFTKTRDAIINDIPIANEEELMLGLKKTIAKQEVKLKANIKNKFERTKTCIIIEAHEEFTSVENITHILKNHGENDSELQKPEALEHKLSNIQNNTSAIIRRKLTDGSDSLLTSIRQEISHTNDLLINIMPNNLQDWNKTRSLLKQMEESLVKDIRKIIISTEENLLQYIQNRLNEIERISKSEKAMDIYQNDMEVDIKQPGRQSTIESIDVVQTIDETSIGKIDKHSEEAPNDEKIIVDGLSTNLHIREHNLCSKCAAAINSQESKTTVAIEINEKYDKMEEINLKSENNNTITTEAIIKKITEENNREDDNISKNEPIAIVDLKEDEILEIPEGDERRNNYSVREQAENSIKLWLARFKQAVPHLPDNIRASKKYDKLEKSIGQKTTEVSVEATNNNLVVINMEENQGLSFIQNETTQVEIHQHPAEVLEETISYPTTLLDIDNRFLEAGGLQTVEESNSIRAQHIQEEGNATNNFDNLEKKKIKIIISEHVSDDESEMKENGLYFPEKLLTTDDKHQGSDSSKAVEGQDLKFEIQEKNIETKGLENEPKMSEEEKETSELKSDEGLETRINQAEENAAKYNQFRSEFEKIVKQVDADNVGDVQQELNAGNTEAQKKEYENTAAPPRKWLKIDETPEGAKETWPSHLPKILDNPKETKPKIMMQSDGTEEPKTDTISRKEWPVSEEDMLKSNSPHEEIIKICQTFENNQHVESVIDREKSDKSEVEQINENKEICPDQYTIEDNTLKEGLNKNIQIPLDEYQYNKEVDETVKSKIFYGDRINELNTELDETQTREQTKEQKEIDDKQYVSNTLENKEGDNWEYNKNVDRKESLASTISDVSTSSSESTSNEELKKEERDTLPTLKLPNMDEKLRKKRKINRRQLKSLDSGVHHYYGEYIAIEFPINESDEMENQVEPKEDSKKSTTKEKPQFISSNDENARRYDGMNSAHPEDGHTLERGNVDSQ